MTAIVYCPVPNFWSMQVGLTKKGSAKLSVYRLKANPTKPASNPFRNGCLICLLSEAFLREDALGMEPIKLLSPAPRGVLGSRKELLFKPPPSTALQPAGTSWPRISLFIARANPAWHPAKPEPVHFRKLPCLQPSCLAEDASSRHAEPVLNFICL